MISDSCNLQYVLEVLCKVYALAYHKVAVYSLKYEILINFCNVYFRGFKN